jgi:hypothetical protein
VKKVRGREGWIGIFLVLSRLVRVGFVYAFILEILHELTGSTFPSQTIAVAVNKVNENLKNLNKKPRIKSNTNVKQQVSSSSILRYSHGVSFPNRV